MAKQLTARQQAFVMHYRRHRNGSRAARQAGYAVDSAPQTAYDLLHLPRYAHVQEAVRAALAEDRKRWEHVQELVLQQAHHIASFDPSDLLGPDGAFRSVQEMDPEARAALAEVKVTEYKGEDGYPSITRKYRASSKMEALNLLAKISGLVKDRLELEHVDIREARARLDEALDAALGPREGLESGAGGEEPGGEEQAPGEPDGPGV